MASGERLIRLRHGTMRQRAEAILRDGPNPNFMEPGGSDAAEGFSTARLTGPYPYGSPQDMAMQKACLFPSEGGLCYWRSKYPKRLSGKRIWKEKSALNMVSA
jgi:hypothetical protein